MQNENQNPTPSDIALQTASLPNALLQPAESPLVVPPVAPPVEPASLTQSEPGTHDMLIAGRRFARTEGGIYQLTEGDHTAVITLANLQWHLRIESVRPSGSHVVSGRWKFPDQVRVPAKLGDRDQAFATALKYLDILVRKDRLETADTNAAV
jgi:hypothetical protein